MNTTVKPTIYVVGAGPGIGASVATLFAQAGFEIGLISRSTSTLSSTASLISGAVSEPRIFTATADGSNPESMIPALDSLKEQFGRGPTIVLFNVASISPPGSEFGPRPLLEHTPDLVMRHITISAVSALVVGNWAAKNIDTTLQQKPMLLFTGGGLAISPSPVLASVSMAKAAMRNLAFSYHSDLKPKGIHAATVTICGILKPEFEKYNSNAVAKEFWRLYEQKDIEEWTAEIQY